VQRVSLTRNAAAAGAHSSQQQPALRSSHEGAVRRAAPRTWLRRRVLLQPGKDGVLGGAIHVSLGHERKGGAVLPRKRLDLGVAAAFLMPKLRGGGA
jgi:hypothetical protein